MVDSIGPRKIGPIPNSQLVKSDELKKLKKEAEKNSQEHTARERGEKSKGTYIDDEV